MGAVVVCDTASDCAGVGLVSGSKTRVGCDSL